MQYISRRSPFRKCGPAEKKHRSRSVGPDGPSRARLLFLLCWYFFSAGPYIFRSPTRYSKDIPMNTRLCLAPGNSLPRGQQLGTQQLALFSLSLSPSLSTLTNICCCCCCCCCCACPPAQLIATPTNTVAPVSGKCIGGRGAYLERGEAYSMLPSLVTMVLT